MAPAVLDARALVEVMGRFVEALRSHREELNSLNVYPVPDGDTGTNMLSTQEAVTRALADVDGDGMGAVGEAVSRASLMGARGNSGVILSQVLRGLVSRLPRDEAADGRALAEALAEAARLAHQAVARPQPGTVLTVLEEAARAAREGAADGGDCVAVAHAALEAAEEALARTPELLPELKRAGVVDAGGRGVLLLFDALVAVLAGRPLSVEVGPLGPVGEEAGLGVTSEPLEFAYEVMYLLEAPDERVPEVRERLGALGDSLVVVGGGGLYNVHVHTNDSDAAVAVGREAGEPRELRVASLEEQVHERCIAGQARAVRVAEQRVALVAVAEGDGLGELFRSLGAVVVEGGPGRNPSVQELLGAIQATGADAVVVLPNHKNVVPAAHRAAEASGMDVRVIPTRSVPQGISAAAAFNPLGEPDEVAADMEEAGEGCAAVELARAVRDAETPAGEVRAGQWMALAGGDAVALGDDPAALAGEAVARLLEPHHEVLTLVVGSEAEEDERARVEAAVRRAADELELEVHRGGQPRYPYLIGIE